jgi:hypothetical protein
MRTPLLLAGIVTVVALAPVVQACDDFNKPVHSIPNTDPRHKCFSDVECPGQKCLKSIKEIQGICSGALDDPNGPNGDAGSPGAAPSSSGNAPEVQPSPNDIHL